MQAPRSTANPTDNPSTIWGDSSPGQNRNATESKEPATNAASPPSISLPKGGGAIRGVGEKFSTNPVTGSGSLTVPIPTSASRSGFSPQLSLSYSSGEGNGPFGLGWHIFLPSITRKTDKGLPLYNDADASDVFVLSGSEDLVPILDANQAVLDDISSVQGYTIRRYQPRLEGLFSRIERWTRPDGDTHWRSLSKDNILTVYGADQGSRIADPLDTRRVFSWLICETRDDKGNAILYEYKPEDAVGIQLGTAHEQHRGGPLDVSRTSNRYLKRIRYGNTTPLLDSTGQRPRWLDEGTREAANWMFETVFDYGEHDPDNPRPGDTGSWHSRRDSFSSYRAGFEVRTYRLCQRVLMFHHFPNEAEVGVDCLVRSTDFVYEDGPVVTLLSSVTQRGYRRKQGNTYSMQSIPPVQFDYTRLNPQQNIQTLDPESAENLPIGLDNSIYQWVDLDGEGLTGILTEQGGAWWYKRMASAGGPDARFGPVELLASIPATSITAGDAQFLDLAGDGHLDVVQMRAPMQGFYERTEDTWTSFQSFKSCPNIDIADRNIRFLDVTGDGFSDILFATDSSLTWYPSLSEDGFGPGTQVTFTGEETKGPRLVFSDSAQSIYIADMTGDGLADLVRIRNGDICYWPNVGYGYFGAQVTMDNAPWMEHSDAFDQRRVRLADIDGSGTSDLIYLGGDGVDIYTNQAGNGWSERQRLASLPPPDEFASVHVLDLLGNGGACLVWSSSLPAQSQPLRYIDLMGEKPHLLNRVVNNLGAETIIHYAPSTRFYLQDKAAGRPWITRLGFVVHVVERVETRDLVSRNRFTTRYAYHHGYFDGVEREFRGFGMVEQWDTEVLPAVNPVQTTNWDAASYVPPVLTRSWFHLGALQDQNRISSQYEHEYYLEGGSSEGQSGAALLLDDTVLPKTRLGLDGSSLPYTLTGDEMREAARALKGSLLRQEVYSLDDTDAANRPYTVSERNFTIQLLQPRGPNQHAIFYASPREQVDVSYERKVQEINGQTLADPRVTHSIILDSDSYGNVLRSVSINYRRRPVSPSPITEQESTHLTMTVNRFTNQPDNADWYRVGVPVEAVRYEVVKPPEPVITDSKVELFAFDQMYTVLDTLYPIHQPSPYPSMLWPYDYWDWRSNPAHTPSESHLRLLDQERRLYRKNDLTGPLDLGQVESLGLPYESYKLAFTKDLGTALYVNAGKLTKPELETVWSQCGYTQLGNDNTWWMPAGKVFFSLNTQDNPEQELEYARGHFFMPHRYRDPFHSSQMNTESLVRYDAYDLLILETEDALGSRITVGERDPSGNINPTNPGNDYHTLQPRLVTDANGNRVQVSTDSLGRVVGTAVQGKVGENVGDTLDGFQADLDQTQLDQLYDAADPKDIALGLINGASTRVVYDIDRFWRSQQSFLNDPDKWQPAYTVSLARETHSSETTPPNSSRIQINFSYSDGFQREIQKKTQAEPGPLPTTDTITNPRWVGSGWTIYNNKGVPVRQYEPFFTAEHRFEFGVKVGVSPILLYDPLGRAVATLHPNHSYEKVVFDPWQHIAYDANDTVLEVDPRTDPNVGHLLSRLPSDSLLPTWYALRQGGAQGPWEQQAAVKAAVHHDTPATRQLDTLSLVVLSTTHDKRQYSEGPLEEAFYTTRTVYDIQGHTRSVIDPQGRTVIRYEYDMLGNIAHQSSMDAGERWELRDARAKQVYKWDSRGSVFRTVYDQLQRPVQTYCREAGGPERLVGRIEYGEGEVDAESRNMLGKAVRVFDQAGVTESLEFDFKGNLLASTRRFAEEYKQTLDWSTSVVLQEDTYRRSIQYDALNRPTETTMPDDSVTRTSYDIAGSLNQVVVRIKGASAETILVTDIKYNPRGQRQEVNYGNRVTTNLEYDPLTFQLTHLLSKRDASTFPDDCQTPAPTGWPGCQVQNLRYTYDPVGNMTRISDEAQQTIYFRNTRVDASNDYTYSAVYQLIEATGREHLGQENGRPKAPTAPSPFQGGGRINHPSDGNAMGRYMERYRYDEAGNILSVQHLGSDPSQPGWTRAYSYTEASSLESGKSGNRLSSTSVGSVVDRYGYTGLEGLHGNMTSMPHLSMMQWDFKDQLHATAQQVAGTDLTPETTWYVYDATGQRVRKVTERQGTVAGGATRMKERLYLDGFELFRKYAADGTEVIKEVETLRVTDGAQAIAMIETRAQGTDTGVAQLTRYQCSNHLNSIVLELDDQARIISYEEYTPFGARSYKAVDAQIEIPKRYGYTGKELDKESGFSYHGSRYYAPWIARWISSDPGGIKDGLNTYSYVNNRPTRLADPGGTEGKTPPPQKNWTRPAIPDLKANPGLQTIPFDASAPAPPDKQTRWVQAQFIPGTSGKTILIVGGIHQDEPQGRTLSDSVLSAVQNMKEPPYYNILIVPNLFADRHTTSRDIGSTQTNRNFPAEGKKLNASVKGGKPKDVNNNAILPETVILISLIEAYTPERALQIHDKRWYSDANVVKEGAAGVFVDPAAGHDQLADFLTREMAISAREAGLNSGGLRGNFITPEMAQKSLKAHRKIPVPGEWLQSGTLRTRYPNDTAAKASDGVTFGKYGASMGIDVFLIEADKTETDAGNITLWTQVVLSTLVADPQTVAERSIMRDLLQLWNEMQRVYHEISREK